MFSERVMAGIDQCHAALQPDIKALTVGIFNEFPLFAEELLEVLYQGYEEFEGKTMTLDSTRHHLLLANVTNYCRDGYQGTFLNDIEYVKHCHAAANLPLPRELKIYGFYFLGSERLSFVSCVGKDGLNHYFNTYFNTED